MYKVGDRVRLTTEGARYFRNFDSSLKELVEGVEGIITNVEDDAQPYLVRFGVVNDPTNGGDNGWWMRPPEIELVESAASPAADDNPRIISLINERLAKGRSTYGQGVTVHDGHAWETEALEEALDAAIYLAARLIEISDKRREEAK